MEILLFFFQLGHSKNGSISVDQADQFESNNTKKKDYTTLEEICFAPLTSPFTGPTTTDKCVVQSVWGYFQNSEEIFNETSEDPEGFVKNYLDHFKACTQ